VTRPLVSRPRNTGKVLGSAFCNPFLKSTVTSTRIVLETPRSLAFCYGARTVYKLEADWIRLYGMQRDCLIYRRKPFLSHIRRYTRDHAKIMAHKY